MDIVTLGELLVDMFPAEIGRRLAEVTAFYPKPGGAPANVAVAAARLGAASAFIGKVGDDAFGHHLLDVVRQEGVETRGVRLDPEARTTMAIIALPDPQHAEFIFYRNPGADQRLRADELDRELLSTCRALHFGSLSLTDEPSRSATHEAVSLARKAGALISFDVNYRPSLWPSAADAMTQITGMVPQVDLLKLNEVELALLAGGSPQGIQEKVDVEGLATAAGTLLAAGPQLVVVTLGQGGSLLVTPHGYAHVPAFAVETVDAVGCGDAFVAGLLRQLTSISDWRNLAGAAGAAKLSGILRYANAVGALTATRQGVIPALPTAAEVDSFLAHQPA